MGKRSPQSVQKRAREQSQREKRELKQAKKDARTAARLERGDQTEVPSDTERAQAAE